MKAVSASRKMFENAKAKESMPKYGTLALLYAKQDACSICYKNFQECVLPDGMVEQLNPTKQIDKYEVARQSFPGCAYGGCSRHLHITEGPYAGLKTESNQWEVFGTLQSRLAIEEPTFMFQANALCNQYGLDVDAAGGPIGWAMECYQRGIIDQSDTDGLDLEWGNAEAVLELIRKICYREGFGNLLAEGNARAADLLGRESSYYALNVKGQDLYELCRGALAWTLGAATATRGGGHTTGGPITETVPNLDADKAREVFGVDNPHKPLEYEGKPEMVHFMETLCRVNNCLGVCHFNTVYYDLNLIALEQLAELYSAATGWETTVEDLKEMTLKQINMEKALNLRFTDFDRTDDYPPERDMTEPIPSGKLAGWKMDREKYDQMLDHYYDLHGWDRATSFPKHETLLKLGLSDVAEELAKLGKLR